MDEHDAAFEEYYWPESDWNDMSNDHFTDYDYDDVSDDDADDMSDDFHRHPEEK